MKMEIHQGSVRITSYVCLADNENCVLYRFNIMDENAYRDTYIMKTFLLETGFRCPTHMERLHVGCTEIRFDDAPDDWETITECGVDWIVLGLYKPSKGQEIVIPQTELVAT